MTGSAGASAAVRIHSPNPAVRPGICIELAVFQILDFAAVTLPASVRCSGAALNYLSQHVIQGSDELCGLGVMTVFELLDFFAVTTPTIIGCDDHGNAVPVMLEGRRIFFAGTMTCVAIHVLLGVGAFPPLLHDAWRATAVAVQTDLAFCGYLGTSNCNQWEEEKTENSYKAHGDLRASTSLQQSYPQLPSCMRLRNCTSNVIIIGKPGALVRSSLALAAASQLNKCRSRNSVSALASETAVLSSDECSQV